MWHFRHHDQQIELRRIIADYFYFYIFYVSRYVTIIYDYHDVAIIAIIF